MNEWQPIETAPKDGTSVLTYPHYRITHWHEVGFWAGHFDEFIDDFKSLQPQPTHWMPLPPPPSIALVDEAQSKAAK